MKRGALGRIRWLGVATAFLLAVFAVPTTATHTDHDAPGWGEPSLLSPSDLSDASRLQVAVESGGSAVLVWEQRWDQSKGASILASRYDQESGWGPAADLGFAAEAPSPTVAMNPDGIVHRDAARGWEYDTIAVWQQGGGIFGSRGTEGTDWSPPEFIGHAPNDEVAPQIAMDAAGNALVVWQATLPVQGDQPYPASSIYANRYTPTTGWQAPVDLDGDLGPRFARDPQLAMGPTGDAMVVWRILQGGCSFQGCGPPGVYASRFLAHSISGEWGRAELISTGVLRVLAPDVAVDGSGNAIAIWIQRDVPISKGVVYTRHFAAGVGWGARHEVGRGVGIWDAWGDPNDSRVALDASGNAVAVWETPDGTQASRFTAVSGWAAPTSIAEERNPQIAMNADGSAIVYFPFGESRRFDPAIGWESLEQIGDGWGFQVAMDGTGRVTAAWIGQVGGTQWPSASRHEPGIGWGPVTTIRSELPDARGPQVAVDMAGNALAVWQQGKAILAKWFFPGIGWNAPCLGLGRCLTSLETVGAGTSPRVALTPNGGGAIVVWQQEKRILARQWTQANGWAVPVAVGDGVLSPGRPLVMDAHGNAVLVWHEPSTHWRLYASRFVPSMGWETAQAVDEGLPHTPSTGWPFHVAPWVELAVDGRGRVIAVWEQLNQTNSSVHANRFVPEIGWGKAVDIDAGPGSPSAPRVASDADGNAIVLWQQETGDPASGQRSLFARRFVPGTGWSSAVIFNGERYVRYEIGINAAGLALAVWSGDSHYASWFVPGAGWTRTEEIPPGIYGRVRDVHVDAKGNALILSSSWGGGIYAMHFTRGQGWGPDQALQASGSLPPAGMDGRGNAILVWAAWNGTSYVIYANRFVRSLSPGLFLTSPAETLTNRTRVTVAGVTSPGTHVSVDGTSVPVDIRGTFEHTVSVPDGTHAFEIVATGLEGSSRATIVLAVDTLPPLLAVSSPVDGATVGTSRIVVAGSTEPGARIVVDGVTGHVAPDGSFALKVALGEGRNTIHVVAADAAGNLVTTSLAVTYVRPASELILPMALLASSGVLFAFVFLLFWYQRGGPRLGGLLKGPMRRLLPGSPGRGPIGPARNPGVAPPPGPEPDRPWPEAPKGSLIRLTVKERVMLHLLAFAKYTDAVEVPPELTQAGIAKATGFNKRHFTQYVRPLVRESLVEERSAHVKGVLQRQGVYGLTYAGWHKAVGLRDRVHSAVISVVEAEGVRQATIGDVLANGPGRRPLLDVVREAIETGQVNLKS